jgi:hypothetical protein
MRFFPRTPVPAALGIRKIISAGLLLGALSLVLAPTARGQITINFTYNGTDTTLTYNVAPGSLSSLTFSDTSVYSEEHNVRNGGLVNVAPGNIALDGYIHPTIPNPGSLSNANWGSTSAPTSFSGDSIRFFQGSSSVRVPPGFDRVTGTLAGTMLWTSTSLIGLGFATNNTTSGTIAAFGTTVNWTATNTAIPEPSTYAVLFGLAGLCLAAIRRQAMQG